MVVINIYLDFTYMKWDEIKWRQIIIRLIDGRNQEAGQRSFMYVLYTMYISPVIEMDKWTFNRITQLLICYEIFITLINANFSTLLLFFAFENTGGK